MFSNDSFRLFKVAGITVYLHWSWFIIAFLEVSNPPNKYDGRFWNLAEYITLFGIVLCHEFGHALACRQVGGRAERIMLWPLGGVAYVAPPARPGALLWSIAAGPLVNLLLVPILYVVTQLVAAANNGAPTDAGRFAENIETINIILLVFNMVPVYPLDGGQILYALLWFVVGRVTGLRIAAAIGLVGAGLLILLGLAFFMLVPQLGSIWFVVIGVFMASRAWLGFVQARKLEEQLTAPQRHDRACPACGKNPPVGPAWGCGECGAKFDTFATNGICPRCGAQYHETACGACGQRLPLEQWAAHASNGPIVAAPEGPERGD